MDSKFRNVIQTASHFIEREIGKDSSKSVLIIATNVEDNEAQQIVILQGSNKGLRNGISLAMKNPENTFFNLVIEAIDGSPDLIKKIMVSRIGKN